MKGPITADKVRQEQILRASNTIKKKYDVKQVILFGSKARGLFDKESDIDFCVIIEEPKKRRIEIAREVRKELRNYISAPLDVLVYDEKRFYERASLGLTLEASILKEGIEL